MSADSTSNAHWLSIRDSLNPSIHLNGAASTSSTRAATNSCCSPARTRQSRSLYLQSTATIVPPWMPCTWKQSCSSPTTTNRSCQETLCLSANDLVLCSSPATAKCDSASRFRVPGHTPCSPSIIQTSFRRSSWAPIATSNPPCTTNTSPITSTTPASRRLASRSE